MAKSIADGIAFYPFRSIPNFIYHWITLTITKPVAPLVPFDPTPVLVAPAEPPEPPIPVFIAGGEGTPPLTVADVPVPPKAPTLPPEGATAR